MVLWKYVPDSTSTHILDEEGCVVQRVDVEFKQRTCDEEYPLGLCLIPSPHGERNGCKVTVCAIQNDSDAVYPLLYKMGSLQLETTPQSVYTVNDSVGIYAINDAVVYNLPHKRFHSLLVSMIRNSEEPSLRITFRRVIEFSSAQKMGYLCVNNVYWSVLNFTKEIDTSNWVEMVHACIQQS